MSNSGKSFSRWAIGLLFTAVVTYILIIQGAYVQPASALSSTTIEIRVSASSDDAEEDPQGNLSLTSSDLELVDDTGDQVVGLRFRNVSIPSGATILQADVQFQADETNSIATSLTIAGQASDYPGTFNSTSNNITGRPTTAASVSWQPAPWNDIGAAGPDQQTTDIAPVIQEIIDRPGWEYNNALVLIISGSGKRVAESYNGTPEAAPLLRITYSGGATPTPTGTPTPLPPGINYQFAVIGDYGDGSADEGRVANLVAGWDPDFVITTGDNNYPDGAADTIDAHIGQFYSSFIGDYQGAYGSGSVENRFWPSLGNHDWHTITCDGNICSGAYFDYFTLFGNERYYVTDYGLVRLFALDSDNSEPDGNEVGSIQANWLQEQLAGSTACYNIVYFHHPPYSSGNHGSISDLQWPFGEWGADAVMSGHDHSYERLDLNGMPYFVNGAGGDSLRDFLNLGLLPAGVTSQVRYNGDYGAMLVTATETGIVYQFFAADGVLIDELAIPKNCQGATGTPMPPTPTNTPLPPNDTPTSTSPPPSATNTPSPPNGTPTFTPPPPSATNTPPPPTATSTPVPMVSPSVDAVTTGIADGANLTLSHTTSGADRLMLVAVSINNDDLEIVTSITYNGQSLSFLGSETQSDDARVEFWKLDDPPTGDHDVEVTFSADLTRFAVVGVMTFTGVDQTAPLGTFTGTNATSNAASVTVPSGEDDLVLAVFSCETCGAVTISPPAIERWNVIAGDGDEIGVGAVHEGANPQVSVSASLTSSDHWAMGAVSIQPRAITGPTATPTNTPLPPTATNTPLPPTSTPTDTPPPPTATDTPPPPTNTPTNTPPPPTATNTPLPPADTPTFTPLPPPPTNTPTDTPPPPTATNTPLPPTNTPTNTPPPPTATNTPLPPTNTPTDTPPPPTATNTPLPPTNTPTDTPPPPTATNTPLPPTNTPLPPTNTPTDTPPPPTLTPTATSTPAFGDTGWLNPSANMAESTGDGDGYEVNSVMAHADDGQFALDFDSGNHKQVFCDSPKKDGHQFFDYGVTLPAGANVTGVEVGIDILVDGVVGDPYACILLSGDGGLTWTEPRSTTTLSTSETRFLFGGANDLWGRSWVESNLTDGNFRVKIINLSSDISRDFSLDWIGVKVHYTGGVSAPTPTPTDTPAQSPTPTYTPMPTATPSSSGSITNWRSPTANMAETTGDGDGFEVDAVHAHADDAQFAADMNSGNHKQVGCDSPKKDGHRYFSYGFALPADASVQGLEIRLDALVDNTAGSPYLCVQLSADGGLTWTGAQITPILSTSESTYLLGGPTDDWGQAWTLNDLSDTNLQVRITSVSSDISRDFWLDWVAVRIYYSSASP